MDIDILLDDLHKKKIGNLTLYEMFSIWSTSMIDIFTDLLDYINNFKSKSMNQINIIDEVFIFIDIFIKKKRILYSGITILLIVILLSFSK